MIHGLGLLCSTSFSLRNHLDRPAIIRHSFFDSGRNVTWKQSEGTVKLGRNRFKDHSALFSVIFAKPRARTASEKLAAKWLFLFFFLLLRETRCAFCYIFERARFSERIFFALRRRNHHGKRNFLAIYAALLLRYRAPRFSGLYGEDTRIRCLPNARAFGIANSTLPT